MTLTMGSTDFEPIEAAAVEALSESVQGLLCKVGERRFAVPRHFLFERSEVRKTRRSREARDSRLAREESRLAKRIVVRTAAARLEMARGAERR